jgi:hypothetical protein
MIGSAVVSTREVKQLPLRIGNLVQCERVFIRHFARYGGRGLPGR